MIFLDDHKDMVEARIIKGWLEDSTIYRERFGTSRRELVRLVDWLDAHECHHIAMESTGIYWRKVYEAIEEREGVACLMVVNARHMRNLRGRKSDVKNAERSDPCGGYDPCRDRSTAAGGAFCNPAHLASWAGLVPRNNESAGKVKSRNILPGNPYLKVILCQVAWAAVRKRGSKFHAWFWSHQAMLGKKKAIIAASHKILILIYRLLERDQLYDPEYRATA